MARVLLLTTPERGHVNPMAGVAQALRRDGHRVGWLSIPEPPEGLGDLGVDVVRADLPRPPLATHGEEIARLVRDREALRRWIQTLLLDAVPAQIAPLRRAFSDYRPEVVALDPMLYQGVIAATLEGIRYAGISSSLNPVTPETIPCDLLDNVRALSAARAALFRDHGMTPSFVVCDCLSPHLNTVFATPAYVGDDVAIPAATHLVGPSIPLGPRGDERPFPWERIAADRPLVYCSFGSQISWQPELFAKVAEAALPLPAQLVLSTGDLARDWPEGVTAVPYAPQHAVLTRASAIVTHGGANSMMESLWHGVPILISPICNDQPLQAHFLKKSGAGIVLDLHTAEVAEIRAALAALLDPASPHRSAVLRIQASYRAQNGAVTAARLIAELAR